MGAADLFDIGRTQLVDGEIFEVRLGWGARGLDLVVAASGSGGDPVDWGGLNPPSCHQSFIRFHLLGSPRFPNGLSIGPLINGPNIVG